MACAQITQCAFIGKYTNIYAKYGVALINSCCVQKTVMQNDDDDDDDATV